MKRNIYGRIAALVCLLVGLCPICFAQQAVDMDVYLGYNQRILDGRWFPLQVRIGNEGEAFEGVLAVELMQTEGEFDRYEIPVHVQAGSVTVAHFPVSTLVPQRVFEIRLYQNGEEIAAASAVAGDTVDSEALLIGVLGASEELAQAIAIDRHKDVLGREEIVEAVVIDEALFAGSKKELDAFQVLLIGDVDLDSMGATQQELLSAWLEAGGVVLLGPGKAAGWFEEKTGVHFAPTTTGENLIHALLTFSGATAEESGQTSEVCPLDGGEVLAADGSGNRVLVKSGVGNGLVISCGFDPEAEELLVEAKENALWQRILLAADQTKYNSLFDGSRRSNYRYGSSANEYQRVSKGVSLLPVALALAVYVMGAGMGLFILFRRLDRSKLLWAALPAASLTGFGVVALMSGALNLNESTAASFHVVHYDENGITSVEERSLVAYADQDRVSISTAENYAVERMEYGYFYDYASTDETAQLRDVVRLGDEPSLELSAVAPWYTRNLVIMNGSKPEGALEGTVWMEEDGLHAQIVNHTNTRLENAMLFTTLGYAAVGDVEAGETKEARIARQTAAVLKESGEQAILEGELLEYPISLSTVFDACVYPQQETDPEFEISSLNGAERDAANFLRAKYSLASSGVSDSFACVLLADTPDIACAQLLKDGQVIERTAQTSVAAASLGFEIEGRNGVFYYPAGAISAHEAAMTDGELTLGEAAKRMYVEVDNEALYGFDLSQIAGKNIENIRIVSSYSDDNLELSVYDWGLGNWVTLKESNRATVEGSLLGRVIDGQGRIFIRYTCEEKYGGMYVPEIIVEGRETL